MKGGSQGVWFPISVSIISKYPFSAHSRHRFPLSNGSKRFHIPTFLFFYVNQQNDGSKYNCGVVYSITGQNYVLSHYWVLNTVIQLCLGNISVRVIVSLPYPVIQNTKFPCPRNPVPRNPPKYLLFFPNSVEKIGPFPFSTV